MNPKKELLWGLWVQLAIVLNPASWEFPKIGDPNIVP